MAQNPESTPPPTQCVKRCAYAAAATALATPLVAAQPFVTLGPVELALDQPRVAVEVIDTTKDTLVSLGPETFNTFLLDTGATAILAGGNPFVPSFSATGELTANGLINDGTFEERGVAGSTTFDVSTPYRFDFAGSDGMRRTLPDTRILSNDSLSLGFDGIVGTPGMIDRVTTFDMSVWSGVSLFDAPLMGVAFSGLDPPANEHRYSIPVELVSFDAAVAGPAPTSGPLPFITVDVSSSGKSQRGKYVFDTGAQLSIIATHLGLGIGLDSNGDGILDQNDERFVESITFGGVGGETEAPLFEIDQITLPTEQGVDLVYTGAQVAILDIDPAIDGIAGADLLTSGWLGALLEGPDGYISKAHLDLRNPETSAATLFLDINPNLDTIIIPEPAFLPLLLPCLYLLVRPTPRAT